MVLNTNRKSYISHSQLYMVLGSSDKRIYTYILGNVKASEERSLNDYVFMYIDFIFVFVKFIIRHMVYYCQIVHLSAFQIIIFVFSATYFA